MAMRGPSRRARAKRVVSVHDFRWSRVLVATLRHSTLPWFDEIAASVSVDATPITDLASLGTRDRLSLLTQFAAHQSLLQFAGISDSDVDPSEWAVVQKRGADCRLLRIAARPSDAAEALPVLTLVQQFNEMLHASPLDVLRQSWARAEAIYIEAFQRLRADATADLRWARQSAAGRILSPGPDALAAICATPDRYGYDDRSCIDAVRALAALDESVTVVEIGGGSPLHRYSALDALTDRIPDLAILSPSEVAERLVGLAAKRRVLFLVRDEGSLDGASREVVAIAPVATNASWILPGSDNALPSSRTFVIAPTLEARHRVEERLGDAHSERQYLDELLGTENLARFLSTGRLPPALSSRGVEEPQRSYVAALALLGRRIPCATAGKYLSEFGFGHDVEQLAAPSISAIEGNEYVFASEPVREQMVGLIPASSRPALARVAAGFAEGGERALLLLDAGEVDEAVGLLETAEEGHAAKLLDLLSRCPRSVILASPALVRRFVEASMECARYRDACEMAAHIEDVNLREALIARAERRTGDYAAALARVERLSAVSPAAAILHGELLYQLGRFEEAKARFERCDPSNTRERSELAYHLGVLAIETETTSPPPVVEDSYLQARLETYRALHTGELERAEAWAARAIAASRSTVERVDAVLDHIYTLFSAGKWREARVEALAALTHVEETQGDRAAGGILFTLSYLAADDAQWSHASQRIHRLRHFYTTTRDDRRVRETDLLVAHLAFCRGRFAEARQNAMAVLDLRVSPPIREAAALILDEIDWIRGGQAPLRSRGEAANVELTRRHSLMQARRGVIVADLDPFASALVAWERSPDGEPPSARTNTESLTLFRSAMAKRRYDVAERIAAALHLTVERDDVAVAPAMNELRILQALASAEFPLPSAPLCGAGWRHAVQNRLGHWIESGSLSPLKSEQLDRIAAQPPEHWIACSDRELLYIDGLDHWSAASREAVAALFRLRVETMRLRRIVEREDEEAAAPIALEGIVGSSAAMRDVAAIIARVARRDVPVCILGESGTGKELLARSVHRLSTRRSKPFTPVNCAALPDNLLESELFGHARGAFTGADRDRPGVIECTDGGTLFLDEIGEMSLSAQAKLLRFLQEGEFRRLGEATNRSADVRIVAATNRQLERAVEEGRFREDLYYRVRGIEVTLPPLRDRVTDIPMLVQHFMAIEREKHRGGPARVSPDVELVFAAYRWPGNVRELQNTIRAAHAIAGDARQIELEHLPERLRGVLVTRPSKGGSYHEAVSRFRRDLIEKSLLQARGNQNQAAALLNISRQALAYQIRELGIMVGKSTRL